MQTSSSNMSNVIGNVYLFTKMQLGKISSLKDFKRFIAQHAELTVTASHLQILFGHFQCITVEKPIDIHILYSGTR